MFIFLEQNIISWSLKLVAITLAVGKLEGLFTNKRSISVEVSSVIRVDDVIICLKQFTFIMSLKFLLQFLR